MTETDFEITIKTQHRIRFTRDVFAATNDALDRLLQTNGHAKVLVFLEEAVAKAFPNLNKTVEAKIEALAGIEFTACVRLPGGEKAKDQAAAVVIEALRAAEKYKIDRHSYIFCIGGGAFLDAIGLAAATAHRGIRLVRFPTTTLSQDDSGVGVKNGINCFGKKNFLGSFAIPYAVVNDFDFLKTQDEETKRSGLIEAIKVALVKDGAFFEWFEQHAAALANCESPYFEEAIERSALLHARHIALGGDPFETGNSRPLDYGHWVAHKLEQLSHFRLTHAQAVSIGLALDTLYAAKKGLLSNEAAQRVITVLKTMQMRLWDECYEMRNLDGKRTVFDGLEEFREHLGGELTILLLQDIGKGIDIHEMDKGLLDACIEELKNI